jgi:Na+/melibiose symporter-like transporter
MALTSLGTLLIVAGFIPLRKAARSDHEEYYAAWSFTIWLWTLGVAAVAVAYFLIGK